MLAGEETESHTHSIGPNMRRLERVKPESCTESAESAQNKDSQLIRRYERIILLQVGEVGSKKCP